MQPLRISVQLPKGQQGLSLLELMIALVIALFLMGGLGTLLMNTRSTFVTQNELAVFQDNERMAMTMISSVVQLGGYYPDPTTNTAATVPTPFAGTHSAAAPGDTISIAYMTESGDDILNCSGTSNATGAPQTYVNIFSVSGNQLVCTLGVGGTQYNLVSGVRNLQVLYGVKRNATAVCGNCVDTYVNATDMAVADWANVISVVVTLTFDNPLYTGLDAQPQTVSVRRVVSVMGKVGITI